MKSKWNYASLKRLAKLNRNKRPLLNVLYYTTGKDVVFTNSLVILKLLGRTVRKESFMIDIETLDHVEFHVTYPLEQLYKIIDDNSPKAVEVENHNITMINEDVFYKFNDVTDVLFDKKLVDDSLKAVNIKWDYFIKYAKVTDKMLIFYNDYVTILILGVKVND